MLKWRVKNNKTAVMALAFELFICDNEGCVEKRCE
jgi:hypothetical protein